LPAKLIEPLQKQLLTAAKLHEHDLQRRLGRVEMPFALAKNTRTLTESGVGNMFFHQEI